MIQWNYHLTKQNWLFCGLGTGLLFNKYWFWNLPSSPEKFPGLWRNGPQAQDVWRKTQTKTRHFCSLFLFSFVEHSLSYFLKCHAVYRNFLLFVWSKNDILLRTSFDYGRFILTCSVPRMIVRKIQLLVMRIINLFFFLFFLLFCMHGRKVTTFLKSVHVVNILQFHKVFRWKLIGFSYTDWIS